MLELYSCHYGGNEELRFEAKVVPWTARRISDVPVVSITLPRTTLDRKESRAAT